MQEIQEKFGNRIRLRVCGLLYRKDSLLLIKHTGLGTENEFWAPPGGGVEFDEPLIDALKREFLEETGLQVKSAKFQFINEFINPPLHAVELFFHVSKVEGTLKKGSDPEMSKDQIIEDVKFLSFQHLQMMNNNKKHNILHGNITSEALLKVEGLLKN